MSLVILGQSGGPTQLSANDDVFGLMTQVPEGAVKHEEGGLTHGDGATAFGQEFTLMAYAEHDTTTAEQATTVTFSADALPYKLRVLGMKIRCISNRCEDFRPGYGYVRCEAQDSDGDGNWSTIITEENAGDMEEGDVREVSAVLNHVTAVVDEDEGLRLRVLTKADSFGTNPTVSFMVEIRCMRVL